MKLIDLKGQKFYRLTVLERAETRTYKSGGKAVMWKCRCDCGNITIVNGNSLRRGLTKSCGCWNLENLKTNNPNKKHGESYTRLYKIWEGMHKRCEKEHTKGYQRYGGRGIKVCEEWANYETFRDWALNNGYSDELSIDRKDVDGNYCPENCTWSTNKEQANNRRTSKYLTYKGETHTIAEWAEIMNIPYGRIQSRLYLGWDTNDIFETPKLKANRNYGESSLAEE